MSGESVRSDLSIVETFFLAGVAAVPLAFGSAFSDAYILPKLFLIALAVSAVSADLIIQRQALVRTSVDGPILALLAVAAVSAVFTVEPWPAVLGQYDYYGHGLISWTLYGAAFYLSASFSGGRYSERLAKFIVVGSLPVSLYALSQWAGLDPYHVVLPFGRRPVSTWGSPVYLGMHLMTVVPLSAGLIAQKKDGVARLFLGICAALAAVVLVLTCTRGAWLGCAAGVLATLFVRGQNRRMTAAAAAAAVFVMLIVVVGRSSHSRADNARWEIWRTAVVMFKSHPAVGVGPGGFGTAFRRYKTPEFVSALQNDLEIQPDAHNDWLQILATLGLAGLAAYLWLHLRVLSAVGRVISGTVGWSDAGILGALAGIFVSIKLSVMGLGIFFLAAVLAGAVLGRGRKIAPNWANWAVAALSLAGAVAGGWMLYADHFERQGLRARFLGRPRPAAENFERALAVRPMATTYRVNLDNLLWDLASARDVSSEARKAFLDRAAEVAVDGVRWRPADPVSYHLLGRAELRRYQWAGEDRLAQAKTALDSAEQLDPTFRLIQDDLAEYRSIVQAFSKEVK